MQKSLADHQAHFGDLHQQSLSSLKRLGNFYLRREQFGNGEITLVRARIGFENLFRNDAEQLFVHTVGITMSLAYMYEDQGEFDKSEQEHLSIIRKGTALQDPYASQVLMLKHSLAHLYVDKYGLTEGGGGVPLLKTERLLLECIETCEYKSASSHDNLCVFELLREQCHKLGEDLKLENLLVRIVHKIEAVEKAREVFKDRDSQKLRQVKHGLARSYWKLGNCGAAEWWYLRLQPELDIYVGVNSHAALGNLVQTALLYLGQGQWDEAEPYFRDAQRRAEIMLEQDDPIKEKIARCLTTRVYQSDCRCCML